MAALEEIPLPPAIIQQTEAIVKSYLAREFWRWFDVHADDKVKSIKLLFIHKTIYLRDFQSVAEMFFGKRQ